MSVCSKCSHIKGSTFRKILLIAVIWICLLIPIVVTSIKRDEPAPTSEPVEVIEIKEVHEETVEERIRREFANDPIMIEIARCESKFRQFEDDGSVFKGRINPDDWGVFQINSYWHFEEALASGVDIRTLNGNIAWAKVLRKRNGYRDWDWSRETCWGKS